jgi:hypothetical protein
MNAMGKPNKNSQSRLEFERPGYSSSVLRTKPNESLEDFKVRMAKVGWTNLEKVGLHQSGPDPTVIHAGPSADGCNLCRRDAKRKAATGVTMTSPTMRDPPKKAVKAIDPAVPVANESNALPTSIDKPEDVEDSPLNKDAAADMAIRVDRIIEAEDQKATNQVEGVLPKKKRGRPTKKEKTASQKISASKGQPVVEEVVPPTRTDNYQDVERK